MTDTEIAGILLVLFMFGITLLPCIIVSCSIDNNDNKDKDLKQLDYGVIKNDI